MSGNKRRPPAGGKSGGGQRKSVAGEGNEIGKESTTESPAQVIPLGRGPSAATMLSDALAYATDGYFVIPFSLAPNGGGPLVPLTAASRDAEQIRIWWQRWPNAGVACPHAQNNLLMVEAGSKAAQQMVKQFFPETNAQAGRTGEITRYYYRVDYSKGNIQSERWLDGDIRIYGSDAVHALPSYGRHQRKRGQS